MSGSKISRRDLLKWGIGAGVSTALIESVGHMLHVPGWHHLLGGSHLPHPHWAVKDAFELTRQLGRLGGPSQLATLFQLQEAMAQGTDDGWSIITIKVFDQVHHPLVFAFGKLENNNVSSKDLSKENHPATDKCSQRTAEYLTKEGVKDLAKDQRFADLRFNQWFAGMLKYGTVNGKPKNESGAMDAGYNKYIDEFPSNVAIQVGLGVLPNDGTYAVHQLGRGKIRDNLADLTYEAGFKGLVQSPLGITCFMTGTAYDSNQSEPENRVLGREKVPPIVGRNLRSFVNNISQSLNDGFGDYRSINDGKNLTYLFDKLSVSTPQRRKALLDSREAVRQSISEMVSLGEREDKVFFDSGNQLEDFSNKQAFFTGSSYQVIPARQEFVAQCAFVAEALSISGQPYRNFSLFLNLNDLDSSNFDVPSNDSLQFKANSYNYVEGMRQLAIGMNILAKAMQGKKVLVVMITDGGRSRGMGDGSGSCFAMLMGPKGPGLLADACHHNEAAFNSTDYAAGGVLQNLGTTRTGLEWTTGDSAWGLCDRFGKRINAMTNMGDWQVGVLDFLNSTQKKSVMSLDYGNFVRFRRG